MTEIYRAENAQEVAERIAAATGAKASTPRDGEMLRVVKGNLFIVDRTQAGLFRLREFERGQAEAEVHSDGFDPIVRALTFAVAPSAVGRRLAPGWESAWLEPRFECTLSEVKWPADEHGSWVVFDGGTGRLGPMRIARSMDATIEEIAQAMAHPEPGGLLDGLYTWA